MRGRASDHLMSSTVPTTETTLPSQSLPGHSGPSSDTFLESFDQWAHLLQGHHLLSPPSLFRHRPKGPDTFYPFWGRSRTEQDEAKSLILKR